MKDYLINISHWLNQKLEWFTPYLLDALKAVIFFFTPSLIYILLAVSITAIDTYYGIQRSKKEGFPYSSKKFREGFFPKVKNWTMLLLLTYVFDHFIMNSILQHFVINIPYLGTRIICGAIIYNEVKSIDESWIVIKGYSFLAAFKKTLKDLINIKNKIKNETKLD